MSFSVGLSIFAKKTKTKTKTKNSLDFDRA
jgi:hypothetical protein